MLVTIIGVIAVIGMIALLAGLTLYAAGALRSGRPVTRLGVHARPDRLPSADPAEDQHLKPPCGKPAA